MDREEKSIYLTFDDGPVPEATPWILDLLANYNAKATFFMVGDNVVKYPEIHTQVQLAGHTVGNHTFNHLKGWKTSVTAYQENYQLAEEALATSEKKLFRPPYGQLKPSQYKVLKEATTIIMWDVLSGDFDLELTADDCLKKSIQHTKNGSVIVFHDSVKTIKLLKSVLPAYLEYFSSKGYKFKSL